MLHFVFILQGQKIPVGSTTENEVYFYYYSFIYSFIHYKEIIDNFQDKIFMANFMFCVSFVG